jgi:hypothetical protein
MSKRPSVCFLYRTSAASVHLEKKKLVKILNFVTAAPFREEALQHFHATDWPFVLTVARRRATAKQKAGFVGSARERREPSLESTGIKSELLATMPFVAMFHDYSRRLMESPVYV